MCPNLKICIAALCGQLAATSVALGDTVTVHVYNEARVSHATASKASALATWIFAKAGVDIRMIDCPLPTRETAFTPACPETFDRPTFTLMIRAARWEQSSDMAMGFAMPLTGQGNHAAVIYPAVLDYTRENSEFIETGGLLGYVMAHELTHLLYRSMDHGSGIMQPQWNEHDVRAMGQRRLLFSPEQARRLRKQVSCVLQSTSANINYQRRPVSE